MTAACLLLNLSSSGVRPLYNSAVFVRSVCVPTWNLSLVAIEVMFGGGRAQTLTTWHYAIATLSHRELLGGFHI